ncbi:MAG: sigma-E factor negative regulatory protein [Nitrococcus sp.]|nr:sigma-E factor negative regulatory protein [Nitrococcus sp.]
MRDELNEQLSALVDDELRKHEADLLLRQLARSKDLRARFTRYCLISAALRRNLSVATGSELSERVANALEDEPSYGTKERPHLRIGMLLRPAAGLALAATGTMAVLTMWPQATPSGASEQAVAPVASMRQVTAQSLQPIEAIDTARVEATSVVADAATSPQRQWEQLDAQVRLQLAGYLIKHSSLIQQSERSATGNMDASVPYMRIVVHEANE